MMLHIKRIPLYTFAGMFVLGFYMPLIQAVYLFGKWLGGFYGY